MNELTKKLVCICVRNSVEIWLEEDRANKFMDLLEMPNAPQFTRFEGRIINKADLVGIFTAQDMEDVSHRKNGQWKCKEGVWHDRSEKCTCMPKMDMVKAQKRIDAYSKCDYCQRGFILSDDGKTYRYCKCQEGLV